MNSGFDICCVCGADFDCFWAEGDCLGGATTGLGFLMGETLGNVVAVLDFFGDIMSNVAQSFRCISLKGVVVGLNRFSKEVLGRFFSC